MTDSTIPQPLTPSLFFIILPILVDFGPWFYPLFLHLEQSCCILQNKYVISKLWEGIFLHVIYWGRALSRKGGKESRLRLGTELKRMNLVSAWSFWELWSINCTTESLSLWGKGTCILYSCVNKSLVDGLQGGDMPNLLARWLLFHWLRAVFQRRGSGQHSQQLGDWHTCLHGDLSRVLTVFSISFVGYL